MTSSRWGVAAISVLALALVITLSVSSQPATPTSVTVVGTLALRGGYDGIGHPQGYANADVGTPCFGQGGYRDIGQGTQVTVVADGTVVATGVLDTGTYDTIRCQFPFTITGVPPGHDRYTVEVAHRGAVGFVLGQPVMLTLG